MSRRRMKVSRPRLTFLSCAISSINRSAPGAPPGKSASEIGRPALARCRVTRAASPRARSPGRPRPPVEQSAEKTRRCFQRVTEGMAEIEERALAVLALVTRRDLSFHAAAHGDRLLARRAAGNHLVV